MDSVGLFPPSEGHDYLWVVLCHLTSMVHLVPIKTTIKASELAWRFIQEVVQLHGLPETIVSNQDAKFTSVSWRELYCMLRAKLPISTAFHSQTDSASKRAIRNVVQILQAMVQPSQRDWVMKLPMTEFTLNSRISTSTRFAPFELNCGHMPMLMQHINEGRPSTALEVKCSFNKLSSIWSWLMTPSLRVEWFKCTTQTKNGTKE